MRDEKIQRGHRGFMHLSLAPAKDPDGEVKPRYRRRVVRTLNGEHGVEEDIVYYTYEQGSKI